MVRAGWPRALSRRPRPSAQPPCATPRADTAPSHRGASPGLPRAAETAGGRARSVQPGCREGWPGLRALAGELMLAETHPGAPQGPGTGGLARGSAARLLRSLRSWSGRCFRRKCCRIPQGVVPLWRRAVPPGVMRTARVQRRCERWARPLSPLCINPSYLPSSGSWD